MTPRHLTMLLQGRTAADQVGYDAAFSDLASNGLLRAYTAFPYRGCRSASDWRALLAHVLEHMQRSRSELLLLQYFHGRQLPDLTSFIQEVRQLPHRPLISTSCGDPFVPWANPVPKSLRRASRLSDITFTTSMGRLARQLESYGAERLTLLPHAACHVRFGAMPAAPPEERRPFDVVFIGSRRGSHNPSTQAFWNARARSTYVQRLATRYGPRLAVFGHGWDGLPAWRGPVPYDKQAEVSQLARVVVGGVPGSWCDYYTSDRPFVSLTSGVPTIDYRVPRVDRLLADGSDWVLMPRSANVVDAVDALLEAPEAERQRIGATGAATVRSRHLTTHRARTIVRILDDLHADLAAGRRPAPPQLDFLLPDAAQEEERPHALLAW